MKIIKEICENPWDFILYETDDGFVINIEYSQSFVDYQRSFKLTEQEANQEIEALKKLSKQIRKDDTNFKDREITPPIN